MTVNALNHWLHSQGKFGECVATTTLGGAGKSYLTSLQHVLFRKKVVILPDNDESGRKHGEDLYILSSLEADSLETCILPDLPDKGDVADYLDAHAKSGERPTELLELIGVTDWVPPTTTETVGPEVQVEAEKEVSAPVATGESPAEDDKSSGLNASPDSPTEAIAPTAPAASQPILEIEVEANSPSLPPSIGVATLLERNPAPQPLEDVPASKRRELRGQFHFHRLNDVMGWEEPEW